MKTILQLYAEIVGCETRQFLLEIVELYYRTKVKYYDLKIRYYKWRDRTEV